MKLLRATCWLTFLFVAAVTVGPARYRPIITINPQHERFAAFALMSGLFAIAYPRQRRWVALGAVTIAVGLEVGQLLIPGRHGLVRDAVAKGLGGLVGVAAVALACRVDRDARDELA